MTDVPTTESSVLPSKREVAIDVLDLRYSYRKKEALRGVTFRVHTGEIHGFVGPNGAGKTTTLKILATLLQPQPLRGTAHVYGMDVDRDRRRVRTRIAYMPDHFSAYRQMTVHEFLDFFAAAYGLSLSERDRVIDDVLSLTDMDGRRDDYIKGLSRGMQQRLGLARVLVNDPDLLLLDEPASGLDPRARIELMEILQELSRMGKTIFISSHILSELSDLCDSFTIIDQGKVCFNGPRAEMAALGNEIAEYSLELREPCPDLPEALKRLGGVQCETRDGDTHWLVRFDSEHMSFGKILRAVLDAGGNPVFFQQNLTGLKQAFMELTTPGVH